MSTQKPEQNLNQITSIESVSSREKGSDVFVAGSQQEVFKFGVSSPAKNLVTGQWEPGELGNDVVYGSADNAATPSGSMPIFSVHQSG